MQCCRKRSSRGDRCWRNPALIAHVTQSEGIAACRAPMALISERLTPHSAKLSGLAPSQRGQVWVWPKSFVLSRRLCAQAKKPDRYWSAPWSAMSGGLNLRWVSLRPNRWGNAQGRTSRLLEKAASASNSGAARGGGNLDRSKTGCEASTSGLWRARRRILGCPLDAALAADAARPAAEQV